MSIIDQLSLSKSGPSVFSKVAVNATNDLFSKLLGSEILASINSRESTAQFQVKNEFGQAYENPRRGSLEFNDRAKDRIHNSREPNRYNDDDLYNYNQVTENDYIEKEPIVANATERRGNNESSTQTKRNDKDHVTSNSTEDNSSQSSQGRIEVDKGILSTDNNGFGNSETTDRQSKSNGSGGSTVFSTSPDTNPETSDKNQPSTLTPSTQLGGLATTESTNKAIEPAVTLKAEVGTQSIKTPLATDLSASIPSNSSDKPHSKIGPASQTDQDIKNLVEGQRSQINGTSPFSRLIANSTFHTSSIAKGDVSLNAVRSSLTNLEAAQINPTSSSIDGSTSSLLSTSNSEAMLQKPGLLANNSLAGIPLTRQTLTSSVATSGIDFDSGQVVSKTTTNSQPQVARALEASVVSNIPLQAQTTASNIVSSSGLGTNLNNVADNPVDTSGAKIRENDTNLFAGVSKDIKINIKDAQAGTSRTTNAIGANILQAHQVAEGEINLTSQTLPVHRTTSAFTPQSILPIENPTPLDVAANSASKTNSLNVQGSNGLSTGNATTNSNQFSGGNNSPQPNLENNHSGNQRASSASIPSTSSSPTLGSEGVAVSRSDGPTGQFSLSQNGNTTNTNSTAPTVQKPIAQPASNQVFVQLTKAVQNGQNKITVQLRPEELGRVEVKLDIGGDGKVKAMVMADKPETLDLLQKDSRILERALQDAGLKTDNNSLSFNLQGKEGNGQAHLSSNAGADPNGQNHAEQETQDDEALNEVDVSATAIGTTPEGAVNVLA
tara:strand:- start:101 stop:2437 length:2337 start_codon:yes stop_codon:yes gene_type:complete